METKTMRGFTLFEIVISVGLLVVLGAAAFFAFDPSARLAASRNDRREADIQVILNAVNSRMGDYKGDFVCAAGPLPATATKIAAAGGYDIAPCVVPQYLLALPYDPSASGAYYISSSSYDTGYFILRNATSGQITVSAPFAERGKSIFATR